MNVIQCQGNYLVTFTFPYNIFYISLSHTHTHSRMLKVTHTFLDNSIIIRETGIETSQSLMHYINVTNVNEHLSFCCENTVFTV